MTMCDRVGGVSLRKLQVFIRTRTWVPIGLTTTQRSLLAVATVDKGLQYEYPGQGQSTRQGM